MNQQKFNSRTGDEEYLSEVKFLFKKIEKWKNGTLIESLSNKAALKFSC